MTKVVIWLLKLSHVLNKSYLIEKSKKKLGIRTKWTQKILLWQLLLLLKLKILLFQSSVQSLLVKLDAKVIFLKARWALCKLVYKVRRTTSSKSNFFLLRNCVSLRPASLKYLRMWLKVTLSNRSLNLAKLRVVRDRRKNCRTWDSNCVSLSLSKTKGRITYA
jgi:hypothetical protein